MEIKALFAKVAEAIKGNLSKEEKDALKNHIKELEKVQLSSATAKDGKVLSYEGDLATGVAIMIEGAPAPDGDYELEDGSMVSVSGGVVTAIKPKQSDVQPEQMKEAIALMEAKMSAVESVYKTQLAAYKKEVEELKKVALSNAQILDKIINTPIESISFDTTKPEKPIEQMTGYEKRQYFKSLEGK